MGASGRPGLDSATLQKREDEETAMQVEMRDIIETDERRNDLESYIFSMRDKTSTSGEYGEFISDADREPFNSELTKAEDWLYDTFDATKIQFIDKLSELKTTGDAVAWRCKGRTRVARSMGISHQLSSGRLPLRARTSRIG